MSRRPRRDVIPQTLPLREELETLVRHYHHLHNEVERSQPESRARRRLQDQLLAVRERFDRVLDEWVPDEELREEWRVYLHNRKPEPSGPPGIQPVVFEGRSEISGSSVEIRGRGAELEVWVDGTLSERIAGEKDFAVTVPPARFRLDRDAEFVEIFDVTQEALDALTGFLDTEGASPPWEYASELLSEGLIDVHFELTPRGRRALAQREAQAGA
jgi:hypothetical protein